MWIMWLAGQALSRLPPSGFTARQQGTHAKDAAAVPDADVGVVHRLLVAVHLPGVTGQLALTKLLGEDRVLFDPSCRQTLRSVHHLVVAMKRTAEECCTLLFGAPTLRALPVDVLEQEAQK